MSLRIRTREPESTQPRIKCHIQYIASCVIFKEFYISFFRFLWTRGKRAVKVRFSFIQVVGNSKIQTTVKKKNFRSSLNPKTSLGWKGVFYKRNRDESIEKQKRVSEKNASNKTAGGGGLLMGSDKFLLYLELSSWAQINSVSSSSSGDWRELACRGTDSQGAPVSVASPSIARPEAIHQSTTAEGRTKRAPVDSILRPDWSNPSLNNSRRRDTRAPPSGLTALLWPDLRQSITQPQQGDGLTGRPCQCCQPFYSPTWSNPSVNHSRGTDSQGAPVSVASPSIARPEAIHQSTTAEGQTHRAPPSALPAPLWPDWSNPSVNHSRGTDTKGASVRVESPSMARPEAIHQSTTAEGQTHRAPPSALPAPLWPDWSNPSVNHSRGTDTKGASVRVDSPSMARPEAIHRSTTAGGPTNRAPQS